MLLLAQAGIADITEEAITVMDIQAQPQTCITGRDVAKLFGWWVGSSIAAGLLTAVVVRASAGAWGSDPDHVAVLIVAEVYLLLIAAVGAVLGGPRATRVRLPLAALSTRQLGFAGIAWAGAYAVTMSVFEPLHALVAAAPSAATILETLVLIGSDMGRLDSADPAVWALVVLRACLLAPVAEELLFRGVLFGWLRSRLSPMITIAITAAAWSAIHSGATAIVPLAFIVGLAAGWVREKTGSVTPLVVCHIVQNVVVLAAAVIATR